MSFLSDEQFDEILAAVKVLPVSNVEVGDVTQYEFDSGEATEYRDFLYEDVLRFEKLGISKTFVLIHRATHELVGYFSLAADAVMLTDEEKETSNLSEVRFKTLPAIKVGKLAINKALSPKISRKGYGSFALDVAETLAYKVIDSGVACRFLTVDADIEYNPRTTEFYEKNGFVVNSSKKRRASDKTVSMRRDIF